MINIYFILLTKSALSVTVILTGNGNGNQISNPTQAIYFSLGANALEKRMNPSVFPSAITRK